MRMNVFRFVDLAGYGRSGGDPIMVGENGVVLTLHHFDRVPEPYLAPAALKPARTWFAKQMARDDGELIELEAASVHGLPAVRQVSKEPRPGGSGPVTFLAAYVIPRATCSAMVQVEAAEDPVTGARELAVLDELGFEACFPPHPYAPELDGGHGSNAAYASEWDTRFPEHPLTLVRKELARITATVLLDPAFRALPPFGS
jgi:hypothetical protein